MSVALQLLVLKTHDLEALRSFYEALGILFQPEQHGEGPAHYSAQLGAMVLELYPLSKARSSMPTERLGLQIEQLEEFLRGYDRKVQRRGQVVIVEDPDGRKVELTEAQ